MDMGHGESILTISVYGYSLVFSLNRMPKSKLKNLAPSAEVTLLKDYC